MILRIHQLTWILIALPALISGLSDKPDVTPVIIDSDGGVDDAFGLFLFLWNEANPTKWYADDSPYLRNAPMKLIAVTTVTGNTGVQNATRNIMTTLEVAGRLDIPVYPGASTGLMGMHEFDDFYGSDGFGDFLPPLNSTHVENEAVERLVELSKKYQDELVIICIGPLTNIALAQRRDPQFLKRIKKIHMMGGSVNGYGNIKPGVEFNIYEDPEAVDIIFRETPENITVMPYDPIVMNQISKSWRVNVLGNLNSTRIKFLNKAERKSITMLPFWSSADPQAVATALWPKLITKSLTTHAVVETGGVYARGAMLVEHLVKASGFRSNQNVHMIEEINISSYQQLLLLAFKD